MAYDFVNKSGLQNTAQATGHTQQALFGSGSDLFASIGTILNALVSMVGIAFLFLMLYGGYLWMVDLGNEERVKKAKNIIITAVIGLGITLSAYALSWLVIYTFGAGTLK